MKTIYSAGKWQRVIADRIQTPAKEVLRSISEKRVTLSDAVKFLKTLQEIASLPEPTKENTQNPQSHILIDVRDDFFKHFNCRAYEGIFRAAINYIIAKYDYDSFYEGCGNWWIGEMFRRGYKLPGQNRPSSVLWHVLVPTTRKLLTAEITTLYNELQRRNKLIDEKLGDSEEARVHKVSEYEQFMRDVLGAMERKVEAWRG